MPGSLLDGCTDFVDDKPEDAGIHPFDAIGNVAVTASSVQMMKGRIGGGMAGSRKIRAGDIHIRPGRRGSGFLFVKDQQKDYACYYQSGRDQFGLCGMKAKDVVFAVHPDLFDKKSLYPIQDEVDSKKLTGGFQPFADRPKDEKEHQAGQGLIKRSGKDRNGQLVAVLVAIASGDAGAFHDHIMGIGVGEKPVRKKRRSFYR